MITNNCKFSRASIFFLLLLIGHTAYAQPEVVKDSYSRWSAGLNVGSPFFWGNLRSFSTDKTYFGIMGGVQLGYQVSPMVGFSLTADYGQNKAASCGCDKDYLVGTDGVTYYDPATASVATMRYDDIYSTIKVFSTGLHVDFNLNRMFAPTRNSGRWHVLLSPAVYAQMYSPQVYSKMGGNEFTDGSLPNNLSLGLGGDVALRYRAGRNVDLQLKSGGIWISDDNFDGISREVNTRVNYSWNSAIGIIWKFNGKSKKDNLMYASRVHTYDPEVLLSERGDESATYSITEPTIIEQTPAPTPTPTPVPTPAPTPAPAPVVVAPPASQSIPALSSIHFDRGKWNIDTADDLAKLNSTISHANQFPNAQIQLRGYADHVGSVEVNQRISKQRAQVVKDYMVSKGIKINRINAKGMGMDMSLSGQDRYSEKARRVDIEFINK